MKKMMTQFHATSDELVDFLNTVSDEFEMNMIIMKLRPFSLKKIEGNISLKDIKFDEDVRVILTKDKLNFNAISPNNFYDLNYGTIDLDIGKITPNGLEESALGFISDDEEKIALAKKINSRLKKMTKAGAIVVNPKTGDEGYARTERYTIGAKELYDKGIKILALGGQNFFKLE